MRGPSSANDPSVSTHCFLSTLWFLQIRDPPPQHPCPQLTARPCWVQPWIAGSLQHPSLPLWDLCWGTHAEFAGCSCWWVATLGRQPAGYGWRKVLKALSGRSGLSAVLQPMGPPTTHPKFMTPQQTWAAPSPPSHRLRLVGTGQTLFRGQSAGRWKELPSPLSQLLPCMAGPAGEALKLSPPKAEFPRQA